jgi:hypothetical protein
MILPDGLTPQEIRVLQEFRRTAQDSMTPEQVAGIRHPAGGGEGFAQRLVEKGYLSAGDPGYTLTERGKGFLDREVKP